MKLDIVTTRVSFSSSIFLDGPKGAAIDDRSVFFSPYFEMKQQQNKFSCSVVIVVVVAGR